MPGFDCLAPELSVPRRLFLEASAGTGKTFAIEHLAIRLLLERGIALHEQLFVTFTNKATDELRVRLLKRLELTRDALQGKATSYPGYLTPWIGEGNKERTFLALMRIERSLENFEEAKVFTLHGFASYLLQKAGLLSELFLENVGRYDLFEAHVKDLLRDMSVQRELVQEQIDLLLAHYGYDLKSLSAAVRSLVEKRLPIAVGVRYEELLKRFRERCEELSVRFDFKKGPLCEALMALAPAFEGMCDRKRRVKEDKGELISAFAEQCERRERLPLLPLPTLFSRERLLKSHKLDPSSFALLEALERDIFPLIASAMDPMVLLGRFAEACRQDKNIDRRGIVFYDDLLLKCEEALSSSHFISVARRECRALFIDEFQDVDARLWHIFSKLFVEAPHLEALSVIGDPKQSIYRFRKADLYTYLAAKHRFAEDEQGVLMTNYRSNATLSHALNLLFSGIPALFALPKTQERIPFISLEAGREPQGGADSASDHRASIHFIRQQDEQQLIDTLLDEIAHLLSQGVALDSCAVLVRDRHQMQRLLDRASERKIPARSRRNPLLTECNAYPLLQELLIALLHPHDPEAIGRVLLGPLFAAVPSDERSARFLQIALQGQGQGLSTLMRRFVDEMQLRESLLLQPEGRALYSDFEQLVQIICAKATTLSCALDYLEALKGQEDESEKLRSYALSTQCALHVLTIHMSKGLEFDYVFALGLVTARRAQRAPLVTPEQDRLAFSEALFAAHLEEEQAEELRLLYVACTRARERLYLLVFTEPQQNRCAPIIRFLEMRLNESSLESFIAQHPRFFSLSDSSHPVPVMQSQEKRESHFSRRSSKKLIKPDAFVSTLAGGPAGCFIHSFSSLKGEASTKREQKMLGSALGGAALGRLCHELLEKVPLDRLFQVKKNSEVEALIAELMNATPFASERSFVAELLLKAVHTPLTGVNGPFTLAQIDAKRCKREMEFLYRDRTRGGFIKGFIDLVFEYEGALYFIDWKSNYLEEYSDERLNRAMEEEKYYLQAALYEEALRRMLAQYGRQLDYGGGFFLFVRAGAAVACTTEA